MKSKFSRFGKQFKRPRVYIPTTIAIIIILLIILVAKGGKKPEVATIEAKVGNIQEQVSVTGSVVAAENVTLSLERGGKVTSVPKIVGDHVIAGETLVATNASDLSAQYASAKASLAEAEAQLAALERGSRPEELAISAEKVRTAENTLADAKRALADQIKTSFVNADNAIKNNADLLFKDAVSARPQLTLFIQDGDFENKVEAERAEIGDLLLSSQQSAALVTADNASTAAVSAKTNLEKIRTFLDDLSVVVGLAAKEESVNSAATISAARSAVSEARTTVSTAISSVVTDQDSVTRAADALATAKTDQSLDTSGSDPQSINAQKAAVDAASANAASIAAQIAKTVIRSPITGVVTKQDAKVGQIASANVDLVSVISDAKFHIEAFVPEADIAKVTVGDEANITLDAYGNDAEFKARVIMLDPAETIIDNVPTYKATFEFIGDDDRIKSGMTANIDIFGKHKENVLVIPQRAVTSDGEKKTVEVLRGKDTVEVEVTTGLRGEDGNVEILSGLSAGDKVVIGE